MLGPAEGTLRAPVFSIFALGKDVDYDGFDDRSDTADSEPDNAESVHDYNLCSSFAVTRNFLIHVEGRTQWSNGVYLTHQEPWRGDHVKTRTFDWINHDRHERGIRHLEYEHDLTRHPWVMPLAMAGATPTMVRPVETVQLPPGFAPEPQALSEEALERWELEQHEVVVRRQARLNMLASIDQDRKDSAQDKT